MCSILRYCVHMVCKLIKWIGNQFQCLAHGTHGDLGLCVQRRAAQEPKHAQDQRMDHTMVVAIALDPHLRIKLATHIAAQARNRATVVRMVFWVNVRVIVRGACANYQFMSLLIQNWISIISSKSLRQTYYLTQLVAKEIFSVSHTLFSKELGKVNIHYTHRQLDLITMRPFFLQCGGSGYP